MPTIEELLRGVPNLPGDPVTMEDIAPGYVMSPEGTIRASGDMPSAAPLPQDPNLLSQALTKASEVGGDQPFPGPQLPPGVDLSSLPEASPTPGRSPEDIMNLARQARELQELGTAPLTAETQAAEKEARTAEIEAKAAPQEGMDPNTKSMLLRLASGLTSAGRELAATPTLAEVQRGQFRRDVKPEKMLSGAAEEIEKEQKELEKGKTDPLVKLYNEKYAKPNGLPEVRTRQEAAEGFEAQQVGAEIARTEAQAGMAKGKVAEAERATQHAADMAARRAEGDLSGLSEDTKKELTKAEENLSKDKNYSNYIEQAQAADSIRNLLETGGELAYRGMPVILARAMGEVGNLSKTEQDVYRKRLGIEGEIASWQEWWASTPDEKKIEAMHTLAEAFEANAVPKVMDAVERRAGAFINKYRNEAPEEAFREHFLGFGVPETVRGKEKTAKVEDEKPIFYKLSNGETRKAPPGTDIKVGHTFTEGGESVSVTEVY